MMLLTWWQFFFSVLASLMQLYVLYFKLNMLSSSWSNFLSSYYCTSSDNMKLCSLDTSISSINMSSNCSIFSLIDFAFLSSVYWVNMSYKRNYWCSCHFFVALIHHQLVSFKQNILHHSSSDYHNPPFWRCYLQIEMFPSDQTCHSLLTGISTICVKLISCHHSLYCTCFNLSLINIFFIKSLIFLTFVLL